MSFKTELKKACEGVEGGMMCTLMSFDGIPVETFEKPAAAADFSLKTLLAEISVVARQLRTALLEGGYGSAEELVVTLNTCSVILRPLSPEYFIALAVGPGALIGRARWMLRSAAPRVAEEL
jgi:predicted regulator of Ras-like GTPase activity (Roadblock/LC7/MglB family)